MLWYNKRGRKLLFGGRGGDYKESKWKRLREENERKQPRNHVLCVKTLVNYWSTDLKNGGKLVAFKKSLTSNTALTLKLLGKMQHVLIPKWLCTLYTVPAIGPLWHCNAVAARFALSTKSSWVSFGKDHGLLLPSTLRKWSTSRNCRGLWLRESVRREKRQPCSRLSWGWPLMLAAIWPHSTQRGRKCRGLRQDDSRPSSKKAEVISTFASRQHLEKCHIHAVTRNRWIRL